VRQASLQHPEIHLNGLRIADAGRSNGRQLQFRFEPPSSTAGLPRVAGTYTLIVRSAVWHLKHRGRCIARHSFWPCEIDEALAECVNLSVRRAHFAADGSRLWLDGAMELTFSGEMHGWMLSHDTAPIPCTDAPV
jgi:hypothetical protein